MDETWHPSWTVTITYDAPEYDLYRASDKTCTFHSVRWPLREGRGRRGEFPLVVVREHFRKQGYVVLASVGLGVKATLYTLLIRRDVIGCEYGAAVADRI